MPRRGLKISEALKLLDELPSGNESELDSSSGTKEYAYQGSDESDQTELNISNEDVDDPSQPSTPKTHLSTKSGYLTRKDSLTWSTCRRKIREEDVHTVAQSETSTIQVSRA